MIWYLTALGVIALDQLTKVIAVRALADVTAVDVLPFLSWKLAYNRGAAFSMLADGGGWQRWLFSAAAVGFSIYLIFEIRRLARGQWFYGLVYALILGGAIGNFIDRVVYGYVVDFVYVHYGWFNFPVFNVADSAISLGATGWILLLINEVRHGEPADSQSK